MKYIAIKTEWYPTGVKEKFWLSDSQIEQLLSAVWLGYEQQTIKRHPTLLTRLCIHTIIQLLDVGGYRLNGLLDDRQRNEGVLGTFLRWQHLWIRFIGYDQNDEPEFVVIGGVPAAKFAGKHGDHHFQPFVYGIRKADDQLKTSRDVAFGLTALAIVQGAMGPRLLNVFEDKSFGHELLQSSRERFHDFRCLPEYRDSPVFIYRSGTSKNKLKHPKDVSPLGPDFRPMRTTPFVNNVIKLGNSIGFDQNVTYNTFRRSYSIKLQLFADVPAWKICHSMSHISGDKRLHRQVYRPTHMPVDRAAVWFGDKTSSPTVANAASQVGTIGNPPNPALYDDRKRDQLRELVQSFIDDEAPAEELIAAYAEINSGRRVSVENSLVGLIRFSEGDLWKIAAITPHVYDHLCGGNLKRSVRLLLDANARSVASKEPTSFEDGIDSDWDDEDEPDSD